METIFADCRQQFPALQRVAHGHPAAFFDGPGGTQVPQRVIDAVSNYLIHCNANHGGPFATSEESDRLLDEAHSGVAELLGTDDPDTVVFGPNMTTLTFAISRALARTWRPGDEVVVTRLDHDANVTPWVLAARDAGAEVRYVDVHREDCTLDLDDLRSKLNERTRLVAVGCASNASGSVNPVRQICQWARDAGALTFLDAVHFAPHDRIDVQQFGCDLLTCSAYKFFGPHVGILWGRRELLESLPAYKVRPAPDHSPGKWMTGTQNHEGIAGTLAAIDYLADLGRTTSGNPALDRAAALDKAFAAIRHHETHLVRRLLEGLEKIPDITVYGIRDLDQLAWRFPTVSIRHAKISPETLARQLADAGIFVWAGNFYALQLSELLGLEPEGMVRIGLVHYNTPEEVDRLLAALHQLNA